VSAGTVDCERHGPGPAAFVCQHLLDGAAKGWFTLDSGRGERPDAICSTCDAAWTEHGEWNDELAAIVRIRVVCSHCYDELRERQQHT
jgi:hypothetical protein